MKRALSAIVCIGLAISVWAEEPSKLKEQKDKNSYTFGFQMGETLKKQGIEVNQEALIAGLRAALAGEKSQLSPEEMRAARINMHQQAMATQHKYQQEQAPRNLEAAKALLAENAKKEGVKTLPSGLQYKVIREGTGRSPKATDTVTVHYRGTLTDGTEFDGSYARGQPAAISLQRVIPGWAEALQMMKEKAKWQIFVPPELAYGERGRPPRIPPNSALIFDIELLSVPPEKKGAAPGGENEPGTGKTQ